MYGSLLASPVPAAVRADLVGIHAYWKEMQRMTAIVPPAAAEQRAFRQNAHLRRWVESNCGTPKSN